MHDPQVFTHESTYPTPSYRFIGVAARKQLFVTIYTYFLYFHFVLNLIVGIYFLVTVRASNRQELVDYCAKVLVNTSAESSCAQLTSVSTYVFITIVAALLLLELCRSPCLCIFAFGDHFFCCKDAILIATRYVYRLRMQKRDDRSRRLGYFHALPTRSTGHTRQASDNIELLHTQESTDDPRDLEDAVLNIRAQSYMPVPMYDHDLPPIPAPSQSLSPPYSLSDTSPSRRIRALPPRPVGNTTPAVVVQTSSDPQEPVLPGRLPNPHDHSTQTPTREREPQPPDSEDGQHSLDTAELSTTAHAALMDHATYMKSMFTWAPPAPSGSQRSPP